MAESNWAGQQGAASPNNSHNDWLAKGMSHDHANEAVAAGERARLAAQPKPQNSGNNS